MNTNAYPAVAPSSSNGVLPSSTLSESVVGAILTAFLESAATIQEIAKANSLSIAQVVQCLQEQGPFLQGMLATLDQRVRLLASRAEAVAIETLREIASVAADPEARRKAATKLLSHFKPAASPRARTRASRDASEPGSAEFAYDSEPDASHFPSAASTPKVSWADMP